MLLLVRDLAAQAGHGRRCGRVLLGRAPRDLARLMLVAGAPAVARCRALVAAALAAAATAAAPAAAAAAAAALGRTDNPEARDRVLLLRRHAVLRHRGLLGVLLSP